MTLLHVETIIECHTSLCITHRAFVGCEDAFVKTRVRGLKRSVNCVVHLCGGLNLDAVDLFLTLKKKLCCCVCLCRFAKQCKYHFYSTSLLFVYEGDILLEDEKGRDVSACALISPKSWMIDFAHVVYGNGFVDNNFIEGLDSVIEALTLVLKESRLTKMFD